jgi:hypothetical protein
MRFAVLFFIVAVFELIACQPQQQKAAIRCFFFFFLFLLLYAAI